MKVALVSPGFFPQIGGVELHVGRLADELLKLGCQVEVLTVWGRGEEAPEPVQKLPSGLVVRWFRSRSRSSRFPIAPGLWFYLWRHGSFYDVVHVHGFHSNVAMAAALTAKVPLVFTPHYHGVGHTPLARLVHVAYDPLATIIFRRAAIIMCCSKAERELMLGDYPVAADKVRIGYNGVDAVEIWRCESFESDLPVALVVGRVVAYKQVDLAIRAVAACRMPVRLIVIGAGPDLAESQRVATSLGLETVEFLGLVELEILRRWQRTASVALTLSSQEAFGLVLLEAVVAGARVIASDIPAHREVTDLVDGEVSFVPVDASPQAVASLVDQLSILPRQTGELPSGPTWDGLASKVLEQYKIITAKRAQD